MNSNERPAVFNAKGIAVTVLLTVVYMAQMLVGSLASPRAVVPVAAPKTAFTVKLTQAGGPPRWVSRAVYNDQTARIELSPDRGKAVGIPREFVGAVVGECMRYDDVESVHVD